MKFLSRLSAFFLLTFPSAILKAADVNIFGLVPCGNGKVDPNLVGPPAPGTGECDWNSLFDMFSNILDWFIWASIPAATIAIAYAGWLMIWGSTNPGEIEKGKSILKSSVIGLAAVLAAALIVKAILFYLTDPALDYQSIIG